MAIGLQPIYTQTVGAGGASTVVFNNIPQTFTDLKLVTSVRSNTTTGGGPGDPLSVRFNGASANYNHNYLIGLGTNSVIVGNNGYGYTPNYLWLAYLNENGTTANTYASNDYYIPGYTGGNFKSVIIDSVTENNAAGALQSLLSGVWLDTSAITTMTIYALGGGIRQHSTFTLYGITKG
jgi:hypothetical protein